MTRALVIEADGGARGNPGPAGYGAVVRDAVSGTVLAERSDSLGVATNNVAEYSGLIAGLRAAAEIAPGADLEIRLDSKLVVEQMSGRWQVRHPGIRPLAAAARELTRQFGQGSYPGAPRARNAHADRLANEAMDAAVRGTASGDEQPRPRSPRSAGGSAATAGNDARRRAGPGPAQAPPVTMLLLRHGETPLSTERRFAGRGDIPLTSTGLRQAQAAARRLAARGGIDVIVTSPLQRTRLTAEAVAAETGAPLEVDEGWAETDFGKWEGLTYAEAAQRWPEEVAAWAADPDIAPPGGESLTGAGHRVLAALDRLVAARPGATVVVVSHVTPMKTVLRHALLAPPQALRRMYLGVACLCEVDWYPGGTGVVRSLNDTAHLSQIASG
jgi:probable phosphoglycerate mutase